MAQAQPFSIHIDEAVLADLRQRIAATRWPGWIVEKFKSWSDNDGMSTGTPERALSPKMNC